MTPAYLNAITTASEELNAKRRGDPNGPFGEYNPHPETLPTAAAVVHLGSLKAKTSEEQCCMLDSGANVLIIPWKPGMKGKKTMCTLVGENKTEGLIVSRLYTHSRVHGAKALFSKMAPEAPEGQFRRFHRKSMIFVFFVHLEVRIRCDSAISGEAPT